MLQRATNRFALIFEIQEMLFGYITLASTSPLDYVYSSNFEILMQTRNIEVGKFMAKFHAIRYSMLKNRDFFDLDFSESVEKVATNANDFCKLQNDLVHEMKKIPNIETNKDLIEEIKTKRANELYAYELQNLTTMGPLLKRIVEMKIGNE